MNEFEKLIIFVNDKIVSRQSEFQDIIKIQNMLNSLTYDAVKNYILQDYLSKINSEREYNWLSGLNKKDVANVLNISVSSAYRKISTKQLSNNELIILKERLYDD